ncbi:MAG: hypothetical protein HQ519_00820 [Planctomycetes bacterium]|nr:hypothetical protein [Planctomycetota bacterium]
MSRKKSRFAADVHYVMSMLNWILAVILGFGISLRYAPGEPMAQGLAPFLILLYFSPLVMISFTIWGITMRSARKFWRMHWIPVVAIVLEYLTLAAFVYL